MITQIRDLRHPPKLPLSTNPPGGALDQATQYYPSDDEADEADDAFDDGSLFVDERTWSDLSGLEKWLSNHASFSQPYYRETSPCTVVQAFPWDDHDSLPSAFVAAGENKKQ